MNKKLVVANWKMNPGTLDEARLIAQKTKRLAAELKHTETVICPPFVFSAFLLPKRKVSHFHLGVQDLSREESGAHTGEVGAAMVKSIGAEYAIVGHSERREKGETDADVSEKGEYGYSIWIEADYLHWRKSPRRERLSLQFRARAIEEQLSQHSGQKRLVNHHRL